eukprot:218134-Rhodomonas_salina.1
MEMMKSSQRGAAGTPIPSSSKVSALYMSTSASLFMISASCRSPSPTVAMSPRSEFWLTLRSLDSCSNMAETVRCSATSVASCSDSSTAPTLLAM